jgi:hypothetical protein
MKTWLRILGILVIFVILCSPALAVSKSDLITYYRTNPESLFTTTPEKPIPSTIPTVTPTPQPTTPSSYLWPFPEFLNPFSKPSSPLSPIAKPSLIPQMKSCPPAVPLRPLYHVMVYCSCSPDATCDCVNPETGEHYPIGSDGKGNTYIVKPGCQCTWA